MSRADAGAAFARCGHEWAREHLPDELDWDRVAELAGEVVARANPAGAPVFAGWRRLPGPDDDDKARALHQLNALRELRMGMHGASVIAAGIAPLEALMVRTPYMAGLFGWDEPHPDPEPARAAVGAGRGGDEPGLRCAPRRARRRGPQGAGPPAGRRPGGDRADRGRLIRRVRPTG